MTLTTAINTLLRPLGVKLEPARGSSWDEQFRDWVERAKREGRDPNDIGDEEWAADALVESLELRYLPRINGDSVVLELGPGSGRLSRHIIGKARRLILVDNSRAVCDFLATHLQGRKEIHHITKPALPVPDASVDLVASHGVFEHIDPDETLHYLREFRRVLKSGGEAVLDFNNIMTDGAIAQIDRWGPPGTRCVFRHHSPEGMRRLATVAGFATCDIETEKHPVLAWAYCR